MSNVIEVEKEGILRLPLQDLNIRSFSNWLVRPQKIQVATGVPHTVGDFISIPEYHYRFYHYVAGGNIFGLGVKAITELKEKMLELGLTVEEWPALIMPQDFLRTLSKEKLLSAPLCIIFPRWRMGNLWRKKYPGCTIVDMDSKTVADFIALDPFENNDFLREHRCSLFSLRQELSKKGMGIDDAPFFAWNPREELLEKARKVLGKYELTATELDHFSEIILAEQWI